MTAGARKAFMATRQRRLLYLVEDVGSRCPTEFV